MRACRALLISSCFRACASFSNVPDADFEACVGFSGWNSEDFTPFRDLIVSTGPIDGHLAAVALAAQDRGWAPGTTFRFANADDADVLHDLNRVNASVRPHAPRLDSTTMGTRAAPGARVC